MRNTMNKTMRYTPYSNPRQSNYNQGARPSTSLNWNRPFYNQQSRGNGQHQRFERRPQGSFRFQTPGSFQSQRLGIPEILVSPAVCKAGRLCKFLKEWGSITKDEYILNIVRGYKIPFKSIPIQINEPTPRKYSPDDISLISDSISKLLSTGAIVECNEEEGQFVSTIFTVPKPDGTRRPIINLKLLNQFIENPHFKMDSVKTAMSLISKNCFMCIVDLKDAYHAVHVHEDFQKYLKFRWEGTLYKYTCIPFGLCLAPWLYTKLNKPIVSVLRGQGILLSSYLDDTLLIGRNSKECMHNLDVAIKLFNKLGLVVNSEKSQLIPSNSVKFLGFIMDSFAMRLSLPANKSDKLLSKGRELLNNATPTLLQVAEFIGIVVAASPATRYGMLYTRKLEVEKTRALGLTGSKYIGKMTLGIDARQDIEWWLGNIRNEYRSLEAFNPQIVIFSDASTLGWGAVSNGVETKGAWTDTESNFHINVLELLAVFYGIRSFIKVRNTDVLLRVDSSNAIAYINNFGGCHSKQLHSVAKDIWQWCEARNIMLNATYINTKENIVADRLSREKMDYSDFMLTRSYFEVICQKLGSPDIDLFATCHTKQCNNYFSWKPDPFCAGVDAFTFPWGTRFYAFPPFNLITRTLNKIMQDKAVGIVVVPHWSTQPWFPLFQKLAVSQILFFGPNKKLLFILETIIKSTRASV